MFKIWHAGCTRDDQKVLGPLYFGLPGNANLTITSLQGNTLSPSLFGLSYSFKIEDLYLVPQVLVYCIFDAFVASIPCTTKIGFQFWEQEPYQENMGDEEGFQFHIQSQQSWQLVACGQG